MYDNFISSVFGCKLLYSTCLVKYYIIKNEKQKNKKDTLALVISRQADFFQSNP